MPALAMEIVCCSHCLQTRSKLELWYPDLQLPIETARAGVEYDFVSGRRILYGH
jgi:hypothetical protein